MRDLDLNLRGKKIGSYEFALLDDNGDTGEHRVVSIDNFSLFEAPISIRLRYFGEDYAAKNPICGADFWLEAGKFVDFQEFLSETEARKVVKTLVCTGMIGELDKFSYAGAQLACYGLNKRYLKNTKDVSKEKDAGYLKAIVIRVLTGAFALRPDILACKVTQDGENYQYLFYFSLELVGLYTFSLKFAPSSLEKGIFRVKDRHRSETYQFSI